MKWILSVVAATLLPQTLPAQDYVLEKLSPSINTPFDEITPVLSRDGQTLFFTRVGSPDFERTLFWNGENLADKYAGNPDQYRAMLSGIYTEIAGQPLQESVEKSSFNQDVWFARADSTGFFSATEHPGFPLNNALPNSLVAITPDPNSFYVINQFKPSGDMNKGFSLMRRLPQSQWAFPDPIEIKDFYTITSDVSLTLSFDGQVLILSAARHDSHGMDIYACFKEESGRWSAPKNLGEPINSAWRETTPFLSEDNATLFFSSNRPEATGGNDIFMSRRLDDSWENWSQPVRLSEPINSVFDDSQPYFNMTTGYLYFSSKRDGNSDVFRIQIAPPQPTEVLLTGRIINEKTGEVIRKSTVHYGREGDGTGRNMLICEDGHYVLKIPKGLHFLLLPEKQGYSGKQQAAYFPNDRQFFQESYVLDLKMQVLPVDEKIELQSIFFQQSKAVILEKSFIEIEKLLSVLEENPTLCIRVEGHTDANGKEADLLKLSSERAASIKTFLTTRGIAENRIESIGFGSKFPLNDNGTEALRQQNRRVEIRIIKI